MRELCSNEETLVFSRFSCRSDPHDLSRDLGHGEGRAPSVSSSELRGLGRGFGRAPGRAFSADFHRFGHNFFVLALFSLRKEQLDS